MATGDKLFIADKLTLDITKNNTDYIKEGMVRNDSYLPSIKQDTAGMRDDTINILKNTKNIETKVNELSQSFQDKLYIPNVKPIYSKVESGGEKILLDIQGKGEFYCLKCEYATSITIQLDDDIYTIKTSSSDSQPNISIGMLIGGKTLNYSVNNNNLNHFFIEDNSCYLLQGLTTNMASNGYYILPKNKFYKKLRITHDSQYGSKMQGAYALI